jgi:GNAT superfamily N-acetyltransferase
MPDVVIGKAAPDDVRAIQTRRALDDVTLRLSLEAAEDGTAWVARDNGDIVGVALASVTQEEAYAGDIFVEPSFRGEGVGGRLLDALFGNCEGARMASVDVTDAAGIALALRRGCAFAMPVLRFAGAIPKENVLMQLAAGDYRFEVDAIDPVRHAFGLDALDRECRGTTRPVQHQRFASAATGQALFLHGEMVAYVYVWPDGRIGPLSASSPSYLAQIFAFALVTLTRAYGASWCVVLIPGANVRLGRTALRAGLRIGETFLLARDVPPPAFDRYVGFHRLAL